MPSGQILNFFAAVPKGLEPLLANELRDLGALTVKESPAGVYFSGTLEAAYRACLWSRVAGRVFLPISSFPAEGPEGLYAGARSIPWEEHISKDGTLSVTCNVSSSRITHSKYAALKVKDAIVDRFRDLSGVRPSVSLVRPDLCVNVHIHGDIATVSIDLSGESLHRRGYRVEAVEAPLKENLAAAILLYSKWPAVHKDGGSLVDLMCGSGTFPIEGALIAGDIAPGLLREYFGFTGWRGHDPSVWKRLVMEAEERKRGGISRIPPVFGFDSDLSAIMASLANSKAAGLEGSITFEERDVSEICKIGDYGLVVANPPYGERLGTADELKGLYAGMGLRIKENFLNWKAALFTGNPELGRELRIRPRRVRTLFNGALECKLLHYDVEERWFYREDRK